MNTLQQAVAALRGLWHAGMKMDEAGRAELFPAVDWIVSQIETSVENDVTSRWRVLEKTTGYKTHFEHWAGIRPKSAGVDHAGAVGGNCEILEMIVAEISRP